MFEISKQLRFAGLCLGLSLLSPACGDGDKPKEEGTVETDAGSDADAAADPADDSYCEGLPVFEPGLEQLGKWKKIRAALVSADPSTPQKGANLWVLAFTTPAGEPIADIEVTRVSTYMPKHMHYGAFEPSVTSLSSGLGKFGFDGVSFTMRGPWEVQIELSSKSVGDDYVVFNVCVGQ